MIQSLKLNDRLTVQVDLAWDMLRADDASVSPEKQALYRLAKRDTVPLLEARFTQVPAPLLPLQLRVALPTLNPSNAYDIDVLSGLVEWLLDARGPNPLDDVRRYVLSLGAPQLAELTSWATKLDWEKQTAILVEHDDPESRKASLPLDMEAYVYTRLINYPSFLWAVGLVLTWTPLWEKLRSASAIGLFMQTLQHAQRTLVVEAVDWAAYMRHVLYDHAESLLHDADKWTTAGSSYDIVPVDTGAAGDHSYWVALLTRYRQENPNAADFSESALIDRPHDYEVLSRHTLSFVALDRRSRQMVGYVTCTLRAIHDYVGAQAEPFRSQELNRFNEHLARHGDRQRDAGFDVYSIDGVHVHGANRGQPGAVPLSKLLVFYALEFVRLAHRELGVSLLMAGAEAAATKAILVGSFGFTHFNCFKDAHWLWNQANEYWRVRRSKDGALRSDLPLSFLTRKKLLDDVNELRSRYNFVDAGLQQVSDQLAALAALLKTGGEAVEPSLTARGANQSAWPAAPFMRPADFKRRVVDVLRQCERQIRKNRALGQTYHRRVNHLLGTGEDNQDCFLYMADPAATNPAFEPKMAAFYDAYRRGVADSNWVDDDAAALTTTPHHGRRALDSSDSGSGSSSASSDEDDDRPAEQTDDALLRPTDRDMRLYTLWQQSPLASGHDNTAALQRELLRIDQAYLAARLAHQRAGEPQLLQLAREFYDTMRSVSPDDWSDDRVMAMARETARAHMPADWNNFIDKKAWVAQHHPLFVTYY